MRFVSRVGLLIHGARLCMQTCAITTVEHNVRRDKPCVPAPMFNPCSYVQPLLLCSTPAPCLRCPLQEKCAQYWPSDGAVVYGDVSIEIKREDESESYTVRELLVTNNRVRAVCVSLSPSHLSLLLPALCFSVFIFFSPDSL